MSEENRNEEKMVQIPLERHLWPDEKEALERRREEKKKNTLVVFLVICLICGSLGLGYFLGNKTNTQIIDIDRKDEELARLEKVYNAIKNDWYYSDQLAEDGENLVDRAISGMIGTDYDRHSSYLSADETIDFTNAIDLGFVGIGVQYSIIEKGLLIERVYLDSPADKAGLIVDDIITEVNHESVIGWTTSDVVAVVRGEPGTVVNLTYLRDGQEYNTDATRAAVENSVYGEIDDNIGYLQIVQFSSVCGDECEKYLRYFKDNGIEKLLIDVRNDGGGYLSAVLSVADLLLDKDQVILTQIYHDGSRVESKASGENKYEFDRIIILGDENSASASEALIGCLTQNDKATFVGVQTYGKSTIQTPKYYADGSTLKLTTGMWFVPKGYAINGLGIAPDVEVRLHEVYYYKDYDIEEDDVYAYDCVGDGVKLAQLALDFLEYSVDRMDGYFSKDTVKAVSEYQKVKGLEVTGDISYDFLVELLTDVSLISSRREYDTQYKKAVELLNE